MRKPLLLFQTPSDGVHFERRWSEDFVSKAERLPGVRRAAVSRILRGPVGEVELHLIPELYFDDREALMRAMTSDEGQAAGTCLMTFAGDQVAICFGEHLEEDRRTSGPS